MITTQFGRIALFGAALALSGCSAWDALFDVDTTNSDTDNTSDETTIASFDDQAISALDFMRDGENLAATGVSDMPTSGSVGYEGVAGFSYDERASGIEDYDVMADATIQANFSDGEVTGSFDNFNTYDDVDLDGELTITEGTITDNTMSGNAIGSFVDGTDAEVWDLTINGEFLGNDGQNIYGSADGTISNGGSSETQVFGDFAVTQN